MEEEEVGGKEIRREKGDFGKREQRAERGRRESGEAGKSREEMLERKKTPKRLGLLGRFGEGVI